MWQVIDCYKQTAELLVFFFASNAKKNINIIETVTIYVFQVCVYLHTFKIKTIMGIQKYNTLWTTWTSKLKSQHYIFTCLYSGHSLIRTSPFPVCITKYPDKWVTILIFNHNLFPNMSPDKLMIRIN